MDKDPLENLLTPLIAKEDRTILRRALLMQTTRLLRRRRRFKQFGYLAALLGCYLAGLTTMRLANSNHVNDETTKPGSQIGDDLRSAYPGSDSRSEIAVLLPIDQDPEVPAYVLERVALASKNNQAGLYRRAADRYLEEDGNVQAALRCYSRSLDTATREDLAISEDDNWLLMELKKARLEGKSHAQTGS